MLGPLILWTLWLHWTVPETFPATLPPPPPQVELAPWVTIEATAYTARCRGCIGITRDGTKADHRKKIVAADPRFYPLGSEIEVVFPDGAVHRYTVRDTGGAIKGPAHIDILVGSYEEALNWGRRQVKIRKVGGSAFLAPKGTSGRT